LDTAVGVFRPQIHRGLTGSLRTESLALADQNIGQLLNSSEQIV
jgi:hypothetical protein